MKQLKFILTLFACLISLLTIAQVPFTPGNLVVIRVGVGGAATLSSATRPVFLDEYTPAGGSPVQSIAMPVAVSGSNKMFTLQGIVSGLGALVLSPNGQYLSALGLNAPPATTVSGQGSVARTVLIMDYTGIINTTTGLTDAGAGEPFSAVTSNGTDIWASSSGTSPNGGLRYTTTGSSTSSLIVDPSSNAPRINAIRNGQLYSSGSTGAIYSVDGGLPTTGPQTVTFLPGIPATGGLGQYFFADLNPGISGDDVLYVANESTPALQKYSFDGTNWISNGIIGVDADDYRGITGIVSGTTVTLYCTRKGGNTSVGGGEIVTLTDASGYGGAFVGTPNIIVTAAANTAIRGIAFAPVAPSVKVAAKTFLQGAYAGSGLHKAVTSTWAAVLNANATSQPYNTAAFGNYAGTETVSNTFFTSNTANDVVDWVLVELRDKNNPANLISRKAGFIREDGTIVGTNGADLTINAPDESYYIVIRHRNHLAIRSANPVALNGSTATLYDFSTALTQAYDSTGIVNDAMQNIGGTYVMWGGNGNSNNTTRASGLAAQNDYIYLFNITLGGNAGLILSNVYHGADMNLDGAVRASGLAAQNDYILLFNVILAGNAGTILTSHL